VLPRPERLHIGLRPGQRNIDGNVYPVPLLQLPEPVNVGPRLRGVRRHLNCVVGFDAFQVRFKLLTEP
jgi:hypothetical protein